MKRTLSLLLAGLCATFALPAQQPPRPKTRTGRLTTPLQFDGKVTDEVWQSIPPATDFVQKEPDPGSPSTQKTEVRVAYDDQNVYIGIIAFDDRPSEIVINQNRRDGSLTETDAVQVLFDTYHDKHNAFIFGTTPTGIQYDAQVSKGGQGDNNAGRPGANTQGTVQTPGAAALNLNWDAVWDVKAQITERGWEAEMVIPLTTLRFSPGKDKTWGMQISRNIRRRNEISFWAPLPRAFEISQLDSEGEINGFELKHHRDVQIVPYALAGFTDDFTRKVDPNRTERNVGVDMKYSVTGSLTLDATVNTDFAQVEVDEQQINLTRFNLFFPEKRPFFLENAGIFDFGTPAETEMFFSRRIGIDPSGTRIPIDEGVRLSGTVGNWEMGFLSMKTRDVKDIAPSNNFGVARLKRNFRNRSFIGAMAVNREKIGNAAPARDYNRSAGVDLQLGFGRYTNFQAFFANSFSPGIKGPSYAGAAVYRYDDSNHQLVMSFQDTTRNFNPEVGYLLRSGYRRPGLAYRRTIYKNGAHVRSYFPHTNNTVWYTQGTGEMESANFHQDFALNWQSGATLSVPWNHLFERLDRPFQIYPGVRIQPGRYHFNQFAPRYSSNQSSKVFGQISGTLGQFYDGTQLGLSLAGSVRRGKKLLWSGTWNRNVIHLPAGNFTTNLAGFKFNWSFTPRSYLQTFTQYNSSTHSISTNVRFALLSASSNGLYVVYNNGLSTDEYLDPRAQARYLLSNALIIKYSYRVHF